MLKNAFFGVLIALSACTSVAPSTPVADKPSSPEIPSDDACRRPTVSVKLDTFNNCLLDDMTYEQVVEVLGYPGKMVTKSGDLETWEWNGGTGKYLSIAFFEGKLKSKAQTGLE